MPVVPTSFLFRYTFPIPRIDALPRARSPLLKLPESSIVPFPSQLDGGPGFAELRMAWNRDGIAASVVVSGKAAEPAGDPESVDSGDALLLWIDTRDTQTIHRASRFCHLFALSPTGAGEKGREPFARQLPVSRAREDAPLVDVDSILLEAEIAGQRYRLDVWFPADTLYGYDPEAQPRLGFYALVQDLELGRQSLTVGEDFPYSSDPSLWASLDLKSSE